MNYTGKKALILSGVYQPALEKQSVVDIISPTKDNTVEVSAGGKTHTVSIYDIAIEGVATERGLMVRKTKGVWRSGEFNQDFTTYKDQKTNRRLKVPKMFFGTVYGKQHFYAGGLLRLTRHNNNQTFDGVDMITNLKRTVQYSELREAIPFDFKIPVIYSGDRLRLNGKIVTVRSKKSLVEQYSIESVLVARPTRTGAKKVSTLLNGIFDPYTRRYFTRTLEQKMLDRYIHPNHLDDFLADVHPSPEFDTNLLKNGRVSYQTMMDIRDGEKPYLNTTPFTIKKMLTKFFPALKKELAFLPDSTGEAKEPLTAFNSLFYTVTPQGDKWWLNQRNVLLKLGENTNPPKEKNKLKYIRHFDSVVIVKGDSEGYEDYITSTTNKERLTPDETMNPIDDKFIFVVTDSFRRLLDDIGRRLERKGTLVGATSVTYPNATVDWRGFDVEGQRYWHVILPMSKPPLGNWFHYKSSDKKVTFTPKSKKPNFNDRGRLTTDSRQQFKLGKFLKLLYPHYTDVQIQGFVHACEAYFTEDIHVTSNVVEIYSQLGGTGIAACMSGSDNCEKMQFVEDCDAEIIYIKKGDEFKARALVWHDVEIMSGDRAGEKITLVDRIYYTSESYANMIKKYARDRGWWHKTVQDFHSHMQVTFKEGDDTVERSVELRRACPAQSSNYKYPYLDTFRTSTDDYLYNNGDGYYTYENTHGGRDGDESSDMVWSEYHDEHIDECDAYYSNRYSSYIRCDVATRDDINDDYIADDDARQLHDGRVTWHEDTVRCETDDEYYLQDDDDLFYWDGAYYHVDDADFYYYDGEYFHVDDDNITTDADGNYRHVDELTEETPC
jgi:hypothetical protein